MKNEDTYKTITSNSEAVLFKEKNSKFYGYAFPVLSEEDVKAILETVKKAHHSARHWCYAYQIGTENIIYRANDDGEPSNTAGMPIYGQIQSFGLTNVLVIVARYFGGVKLGAGGLIQAYRTTAQMALESCNIIEKTVNVQYQLSFDYKDMNKVMRIIKEKQLHIVKQELELRCNIVVSVRKKEANLIYEAFNLLFGIAIKAL